MKKMFRLVALVLLAAIMISMLSSCSGNATKTAKITVRLVAPQNSYIEDFDTNSYKLWLEEQTGLKIEMTWLPIDEAEQMAKMALSTGADLPDAYIGFGSYAIFKNSNLQRYGEQGVIISLDGLIEEFGVNMKNLCAELPEYTIEEMMAAADGHIYFMPGFSSSTITRFRQMFWVNKGWLDALNRKVPATTEEFRDMLRAFKSKYPDSIPMAGTEDAYSKQPYDYLFNAFIYNDINNTRLLQENNVVSFAPVRDEWRDALVYMRELYDEGLYSPLSFTQDDQQLKQMANDRRDILGAFASPGITLTVQQNSPEIMERYIGIGPLAGPEGIQFSTVFTSIPKANGVITSACEHPKEVFKLFDLMLSEEACLMGRYGTRGEDWDFAAQGDISIYGTPATISIINQLWNTRQNKHLMQIGPYASRPKFSGGVTWDGNVTDGEYMNAQAALLHRDHEPDEYIRALVFSPEEEAEIQTVRTDIAEHVNETIIDFITGKRDVRSDTEWEKYLREFDDLGLAKLLETAQTAHDRQIR